MRRLSPPPLWEIGVSRGPLPRCRRRRQAVVVPSRQIVIGGSILVIVLATPAAALHAQEKTAVAADRTNASIRQVLATKTDIEALNVPFADFVSSLAKRQGVPIRLGKGGLRRAEVDPKLEITASFKQVPLGVALRQILQPLKLQHRIVDGTVVIDDIGEPPDDDLAQQAVVVREQQVVHLRIVPVARIAKAVFKVNGFNNAVAPTPAQQMRRLLQIELNFVQTVCTPSPEQLRQLRQDGLKQITDAINNWQVENGGTLPSYAREIVQDEVMASVRTRLSPAQVARYVSEIQKRKANVRQACARNLVVRLDRELCLTARQREKLCAELAGNWDDAWTVSVVMTSMNEQGVIPTVPDELIVPHLDALQRLLWNRLLKRGKIIWRVDETAFLGMTPPDMDDED